MNIKLTVLAKSDKHTGLCVAGIDAFGKFIRLVRDKEGHALRSEQCKFKKLDFLTVDATAAPLKHQEENYVLNELIKFSKSNIYIEDLKQYIQNPSFVFLNTNPWLIEEEINKQRTSFLFVEVNDLHIYENDEGKYKCDFTYNNQNYERFSITDPEFKLKIRKISKAVILVSLPDTSYNKYGKELYYKFVCAVYPLEDPKKSYEFDCYKI